MGVSVISGNTWPNAGRSASGNKDTGILEYLQLITEGKGDFLDGYDDGM